MISSSRREFSGRHQLHSLQLKSWAFRISHILSEIVDSAPVAMATKSENTSISTTFGPGAAPMHYESLCIVWDVVELCGSYKFVMAQFLVRPSSFHYIHFIAQFRGSFPEESPKNDRNTDITNK